MERMSYWTTSDAWKQYTEMQVELTITMIRSELELRRNNGFFDGLYDVEPDDLSKAKIIPVALGYLREYSQSTDFKKVIQKEYQHSLEMGNSSDYPSDSIDMSCVATNECDGLRESSFEISFVPLVQDALESATNEIGQCCEQLSGEFGIEGEHWIEIFVQNVCEKLSVDFSSFCTSQVSMLSPGYTLLDCFVTTSQTNCVAKLLIIPGSKVATIELCEANFKADVHLSDACLFVIAEKHIYSLSIDVTFSDDDSTSLSSISSIDRVVFHVQTEETGVGTLFIPSDLLEFKSKLPVCLRDYDVKTDWYSGEFFGWNGQGVATRAIDFATDETVRYEIEGKAQGPLGMHVVGSSDELKFFINQQEIVGKITSKSPIIALLQNDSIRGVSRTSGVSTLYTVEGKCGTFGVVCDADFIRGLSKADLEEPQYHQCVVSLIDLETNEILVELGLNDKMVYDFRTYQLFNTDLPLSTVVQNNNCYSEEIAFKCKQSVFFYLADLADKIKEEKKEASTRHKTLIKNHGELESF